MIETQINGLAHAQDLSLDIMAFTIVKQLVDSTESMLDAEANVAPWLQNLTEFASQFFKKYHSVDMLGLLTLLLHKMRDEDSYILGFVLHQLIVKLFGWSDHVINQLPANQLNVLAAGFALLLEGRNQTQQFRKNSKSSEALVSLFWDAKSDGHSKLGMRLMAHLAQQTQFILNKF